MKSIALSFILFLAGISANAGNATIDCDWDLYLKNKAENYIKTATHSFKHELGTDQELALPKSFHHAQANIFSEEEDFGTFMLYIDSPLLSQLANSDTIEIAMNPGSEELPITSEAKLGVVTLTKDIVLNYISVFSCK
ncbi:MAG: hypothetical protein AB8E15_05275 [Bdellovibrionales bacterium]